jgi:uncharacterized membrane protein
LREALLGTTTGRLVVAAVALLTVATCVGLVILWPGDAEVAGEQFVGGNSERAEVISISSEGCEQLAGLGCRQLEIELESGPQKGERGTVAIGGDEFSPDISVGDEIRVMQGEAPGGGSGIVPSEPAAGEAATYNFVDFERKMPIAWLALIFALLVVLFGRLKGVRSLIGLGLSLAIVVLFVAPAILDGSPPLLVALVGGIAVMLATIFVTHGFSPKSLSAILGTTASVLLLALLAVAWVSLAHITGFASEDATILQGSGGDISLSGLVVAGMVIGALGVLDDVTVSQASTVMALRHANASMKARELFASAVNVGRDHVAATVNTLVLAYVGAALPVLLIFSFQDTSFSNAINSEIVATEVIGMLVGSIGLIAAVPLTTGLAALLAVRLPSESVGGGSEHGHAH